MARPNSIQSRLMAYLLVGVPILWLGMVIAINWQLWHEINEMNDSQLVQFGRYLATTAQHTKPTAYAVIDPIDNPAIMDNLGHAEDDYIGFAIWDSHGQQLLSDENGKDFAFLADQYGFLHSYHHYNPFSQSWRLLYLQTDNPKLIIAVGQNLSSRQEIFVNVLISQTLPVLVGLLGFWALLVIALKQGFMPLHKVGRELSSRSLHDSTPLSADVPSEIKPLVVALNHLFDKVAQTLLKEQRFTADAAHELRSPLAAITLQIDVLQQRLLLADNEIDSLILDDIADIKGSIERANHLVTQLLTLARLDPQQGLDATECTPIDWLSLSDDVLSQVNRQAREKNSQLKRVVNSQTAPFKLTGNVALLQILLRNLLDNAIGYTPNGSTITLELHETCLIVKDNGHGVDLAHLERLTERFFRPNGQSQQGSGLGLSIVWQIAKLHNLQLDYQNLYHNGSVVGFCVKLSYLP